MRSFREYITEALLELDKRDIDLLYSPLKDVVKEIQSVWRSYKPNDKQSANETMQKFREIFYRYPAYKALKIFKSSDLKSDIAKQAHAVNPITISIYLSNDGPSFYNPTSKHVVISVHKPIINDFLYNLDRLKPQSIEVVMNEITDIRIKTSIRHELTHWLDDSLHNFHMTNAVKTVGDIAKRGGSEKEKMKVMYNGEVDVRLADVEITAFVNQIAELKRRMPKKQYDALTWVDLIKLIPSMFYADKDLGAEFRKKVIARMARENLVGDNLTKKLTA